MALVEEELPGEKSRKGRLVGDVRLEGAKFAGPAPALGPCKGNVGMEGPGVGLEAAGGGRGDKALLQVEELRSDLDAHVKNSRAIEDAQAGELDGEGREAEWGETGDEAVVLRLSGVAKELQRDVPGLGRRPAETGCGGAQPRGELSELGADGFGEWNAEEKAHGG